MAGVVGRPVRPGEVPKFGSLWRYGDVYMPGGLVYMTIAVRDRRLVCLAVAPGFCELRDGNELTWVGADGVTFPAWRCIDEGPDA